MFHRCVRARNWYRLRLATWVRYDATMRRALTLVVLVAACGRGPSSTIASPPPAADPSHARGRQLFLAKCDQCHGYPAADALGDAAWPTVMRAMGSKSFLTPEESDLVMAYVRASRRR